MLVTGLGELIAGAGADVAEGIGQFATPTQFAIANLEIYNRKSNCQGGEIGRRARLRIWWRNP